MAKVAKMQIVEERISGREAMARKGARETAGRFGLEQEQGTLRRGVKKGGHKNLCAIGEDEI